MRHGSVLPQQKCSAMTLLSRWGLEHFERILMKVLYILILKINICPNHETMQDNYYYIYCMINDYKANFSPKNETLFIMYNIW